MLLNSSFVFFSSQLAVLSMEEQPFYSKILPDVHVLHSVIISEHSHPVMTIHLGRSPVSIINTQKLLSIGEGWNKD